MCETVGRRWECSSGDKVYQAVSDSGTFPPLPSSLVFVGTITNVVTVLLGTAIGFVVGARIPERLRTTITGALGLVTIGLGVREILSSDRFVIVVSAVLVGAVVGELLRIEQGLERLGNWLQRRLTTAPQEIDVELPESSAPQQADDADRRFAQGFVIASLVFCIGPLTILGSIQDGLGDPELLIVKAGLDGFASVAFAAIYGLGVGLAALTVLVVQGGIALAAGALEGVLTDPMIDALASAGGILLIGIALRLLELKHLRVANMLPALAIAPLLVWIFP